MARATSASRAVERDRTRFGEEERTAITFVGSHGDQDVGGAIVLRVASTAAAARERIAVRPSIARTFRYDSIACLGSRAASRRHSRERVQLHALRRSLHRRDVAVVERRELVPVLLTFEPRSEAR